MEESSRSDNGEECTSGEEECRYSKGAAEAAEMIEADETEGFVMAVAQKDPELPDGLVMRTSIAASSDARKEVEGVDYGMLAMALESTASGRGVSLKRAAAAVLKYAREQDSSRWD